MEAKQKPERIIDLEVLRIVLACIVGAVFLYLLKPLLFVDFWYDEVLSLEEFILVPLKKTVTDYSVPNNHVFFSLLMNIWLKLWGIETFAQAANNVFVVRVLPVVFSLLTMFFVYKTGKQFGKTTGLIALLILLTSVPFYNFSAQVRGYGLSIALCSMLLFNGIRFYNFPNKKYGVLVAVLTSLLFYTIPSNLYAVLSVLAILGMIFLRQWYKYHLLVALRFNAAKLIGWLVVGTLLATLLYLPLGSSVVNNEYVKSEGMFRWEIWSEAITFYSRLYKWDWVLLVILGLGFISIGNNKNRWVWIFAFLPILVLPFFISFIRGGEPFDRTFLWLIPVFVLWVSVIVSNVFQLRVRFRVAIQSIFSLLLVFFFFRVATSSIFKKYVLYSYTLKKEIKFQNIYYNYYLGRYNPNRNLGLLKEKYYQEGTQVFLHEVDKRAMPAYLLVHDLKWQPYKDTITKIDEYYIVTAFEQQAIEEYKQVDSAFTFKRLNEELDFVNIIQAKRTK